MNSDIIGLIMFIFVYLVVFYVMYKFKKSQMSKDYKHINTMLDQLKDGEKEPDKDLLHKSIQILKSGCPCNYAENDPTRCTRCMLNLKRRKDDVK